MLSSITGISDPFLRELSDVYTNILTALTRGTVKDDVAKLALALNEFRATVLPTICPQLFKSASDVLHIDEKDILPVFSGLILHLSARLHLCSEDHLGVIEGACYKFKVAAEGCLSITLLEGAPSAAVGLVSNSSLPSAAVGLVSNSSLPLCVTREAMLKEAGATSDGGAAP